MLINFVKFCVIDIICFKCIFIAAINTSIHTYVQSIGCKMYVCKFMVSAIISFAG